MDLVLRLREARRVSGLSQKTAARLSGVGEKTISSLETGLRISSLKVEQLRRLVNVYGFTLEFFVSAAFEQELFEGRPQLAHDVPIADERLLEIVSTVQTLSDERRERFVRGALQSARLAKQADRRGVRLAG